MVLPYVEQAPLYSSINQDLSIFSNENQTLHAASVSSYLCPSDANREAVRDLVPDYVDMIGFPRTGLPRRMAYGNYVGCTGPIHIDAWPAPPDCRVDPAALAQANGAFADGSSGRAASVTDGLSQTVFLSERAVTPPQRLAFFDPSSFTTVGWWIVGNEGRSLFTSMLPINAPIKHLTIYPTTLFGPSSLHPGGLNVAMGDGSVRFVKESVDSWPARQNSGFPVGATGNAGSGWSNLPSPGVWQKIASISGNEAVSADAY